VESQLTNIQSFCHKGNLPSQLEPNPKREDFNVVMTRSKRIQKSSDKKKGSFPEAANDVLTKKDQAPKKFEVPSNGNPMPKKEGDEKKEIFKYPQVSLHFPHRVKNNQRDVQFRKFLEIMSKVHINFHFIKAISHMSSYAKHLK